MPTPASVPTWRSSTCEASARDAALADRERRRSFFPRSVHFHYAVFVKFSSRLPTLTK